MVGREYFGMGDGVVISYHNPYKADLFNTKKEAKKFASTFYIGSLELVIDEALPNYRRYDNSDNVYRKIPLINTTMNVKYNGEGMKEVVKWWMTYHKSEHNSIEDRVYSSWPQLYMMCKHLWGVSGYIDKKGTKMTTIQFCVAPDSKLSEFKKELKLVLGDITYTQDGYKVMSIFDHECSEYESRFLYYKDDTDCKIMNHSGRELGKGTLETCFEIMKTYYYYNKH